MTYRLTVSIPYEGDTSWDFSSLDELREFISRSIYGYDDMEIIRIAEHMDARELMEDFKW